MELTEDISGYIENDFREFIRENVDEKLSQYMFTLVEIYRPGDFADKTPDVVVDESRFQYKKSKSYFLNKKVGAIAVGAAAVFMAHPIIGTAVAIFGGRYFGKEEAKLNMINDKQALKDAVKELNREAGDGAMVMLTQTLKTVEDQLSENIEEAYQYMMDLMVQALNSKKQDRANYSDQLYALKTMIQEAEAILG